MSQYYTPKRNRNLFDPYSSRPYKLSRTKIDLFFECPKCFYLDRRLGVARPPGFPFTLNSAVDTLLKQEFDMTLIPYSGNDDWVEDILNEAHQCLLSDKIPAAGKDCDFCAYRCSVTSVIS